MCSLVTSDILFLLFLIDIGFALLRYSGEIGESEYVSVKNFA